MQLKKGQIVEFDIHALAFGGAGLGKYEGLTVFVEGTMPGDRVKAGFTRIKPNFAEADLVEIVKPSEDRCEPKCPYFGVKRKVFRCGGCHLQFMPYEKQLEFKKQHVIDAFERIGKIYDPPVQDVLGMNRNASCLTYYYRNKMEFSFGYDENMNFALGMHVTGRRYDILDLKECYLQSEFSVEIVNKIREFALIKGWEPRRYSTDEGFLKSLYIREGKRTGEVMVNLVTSGVAPDDFEDDLEEFAGMILAMKGSGPKKKMDSARYASEIELKKEIPVVEKKIVSIYWSDVITKRGMPTKRKETLLYGKKTITEKLILENGDELVFDISPQAFFQVNTFQAEVLYSQVMKFVGDEAPGAVFDLFCGTGTIGLFLAKHCEQVLGIEVDEETVKAARENAQKNKIFNIDFYTGDVNKVLKRLRERPSLIVIDPPRAGITEKIVKQINDFAAPKIIYVSCNPSTLARDCNWLKDFSYNLKAVQPVDMFPHTYHIENVCLLER